MCFIDLFALFQTQVWIGLGLSLIIAAGCSSLVIWISLRFLNVQIPFANTSVKMFMYLFRVITAQGKSYSIIILSNIFLFIIFLNY